jgi:hypothetical protein
MKNLHYSLALIWIVLLAGCILSPEPDISGQTPPSSIPEVCSEWLTSGSKMHDPDTIKYLAVAEAFRPYESFWKNCGNPLNELVTACETSSVDCPNGVLDSEARAWLSKEYREVIGDETVQC